MILKNVKQNATREHDLTYDAVLVLLTNSDKQVPLDEIPKLLSTLVDGILKFSEFISDQNPGEYNTRILLMLQEIKEALEKTYLYEMVRSRYLHNTDRELTYAVMHEIYHYSQKLALRCLNSGKDNK